MSITQIVTIVCNPKSKNLPSNEIEQLASFLGKNSRVGEVKQLDKNIAYQLQVETDLPVPELRTSILSSLDKQQVDIIIEQQNGNIDKDLVVCDMESTIIENEFLDDIAEIFGIKEKIEEITAKAMNGEISFDDSINQRLSLLKGADKKQLQDIYTSKVKVNQGAIKMAEEFSSRGKHTIIVSGGFTLFTDMLLQDAPFKAAYANKLEFKNGKLSGLIPPILNGKSKEEILLKYCEDNSIAVEKTMAIGDGSNDLYMLNRAGLGLAYKAKPVVKQQVGNQINHSDFTTLLYVQGIGGVN